MKMSLDLLRHMWECGAYSLHKMFDLVTQGEITEEQFHEITRYNYRGVKQTRGWE